MVHSSSLRGSGVSCYCFAMLRQHIQYVVPKMILLIYFSLLLTACDNTPLNYPYGKYHANKNIYFTSFLEQPKTLDPAKSYSLDEAVFTGEIYEPPLQYNYLARPYVLEPLTLRKMPDVYYYNQSNQLLHDDMSQVAYTKYVLEIKPGIYYQPHPAFAKDKNGNYYYQNMSKETIKKYAHFSDFKYVGTRELIADDYVLEIKRLATPSVQSPIYGFLTNYIVGFDTFHQALSTFPTTNLPALFATPLVGVSVIDKYHYSIMLKGDYPQFKYWLATAFFAPMPKEVLTFYNQPGMIEKNYGLDWFPVGTGPYQLVKNDPNSEMILEKNPNFHTEYFPTFDEKKYPQFLIYRGKRLPFIDKIVFTLEKENIPRWYKFLQGYYDQSGISADQFEQAIVYNEKSEPMVGPRLAKKRITLETTLTPSIFYLGFNMLDPVVGGYTEQARELRQAISIAINYEEFIALFMNGRAIPSQGPIPTDIYNPLTQLPFYDPYVYQYQNGKIQRKPLSEAKKLLAKAGYPNGINPKTGRPLILNYAAVGTNGPDERAEFEWFSKEFAKLGIALNVESTQYSRFQEKLRTGNIQLFSLGWQADYPDPENFLFLFYGPNSKVLYGGENVVNYQNPVYDALFNQLKRTHDLDVKRKLVNSMVAILQKDAPWAFGYNQQIFVLAQQWVLPKKLNGLSTNTLKYYAVLPSLRSQCQSMWNHANWVAGVCFILAIIFLIAPAVFLYRWKAKQPPKRYE